MAADTVDQGGCSPYEAVLGERFSVLHQAVRRAHLAPLTARGTLVVSHGSHWLTPLLIVLLRLPEAGPAQPVWLEVQQRGREMVWMRQIGRTVLRTRQRAAGSRILEHHGIGHVSFDLAIEEGALLYRQASMYLGPVAIPAVVRPRVQARVSAAPRGWHVEVSVTWRGRDICRYAGAMEAA
jgi:hypothetical protein